MSRPRWLEVTARAALAAVLATACTGGSHRAGPKSTTSTTSRFTVTPTRELTIHPPVVTTGPAGKALGATDTVVVRITPSIDHKPHVTFAQHNVAGTGPEWAAAGWNAVMVAMLTTGAPLSDREIQFDVTGPTDGTAAGALMAVAVIALMRGDQLRPGVTMTGGIDPDGTIAPAAGIFVKVARAGATHAARLLVPVGGHEAPNAAGKPVDVIAQGRRLGVRVVETPDVYDAYRQLTGQALPQLPAAKTTRLDASAYDKMRSRVASWQHKYDAALYAFATLSPSVQQDLEPFVRAAKRDEQDAAKLGQQGLQAGALSKAIDAASLMNATAQVGQSYPTLLAAGVKPFVAQLKESTGAGDVRGLVDSLKRFAPQTVGDAGALADAYGYAVDALSSSRIAQVLFTAPAPSPDVAVTWAAQGAVYYELTPALVEAANETLSVGAGLGGPAYAAATDRTELAAFFRRAAEANLGAFQSTVVPALARAQRVSLVAVQRSLAAADSEYALARAGDAVLTAFPPYFANSSTTDLAELGAAMNMYVRSADLWSRYVAFGTIDSETFALTGLADADAFNSVIEGAQSRLAESFGALRAAGVNPFSVAADNEVASVDQNGSVSDQFAALRAYWSGYLESRVLGYLGGDAPS